MANPLSASTFLSALKAEGVKVVERSGWSTHNRGLRGDGWGPVNGVVIHHTAGTNSLALCVNGTDDLTGPLCHTHLSKTGTATLVGYGRTNHAGGFAQNAHDAVVSESATHPRPDAAEPVDGNAHYYGIEIENLGNGTDPYPAMQYDQAVRWASAICRAHGWSEDSVIGHKEGTRRKIDPSFSMDAFRQLVAERLTHPASWNPDEEDDMTITDADAEKVARKVLTLEGVIVNPVPGGSAHITLAKAVGNTYTVTRRTDAKLTAQQAVTAKLVETVAALAAGLGELDPETIVAELKAAIEGVEIRIDATPDGG